MVIAIGGPALLVGPVVPARHIVRAVGAVVGAALLGGPVIPAGRVFRAVRKIIGTTWRVFGALLIAPGLLFGAFAVGGRPFFAGRGIGPLPVLDGSFFAGRCFGAGSGILIGTTLLVRRGLAGLCPGCAGRSGSGDGGRGDRLLGTGVIHRGDGFPRPPSGLRIGFIHDGHVPVTGVFFCQGLFVQYFIDEVLFGQFIKTLYAESLGELFQFRYQLVIQLQYVVHGKYE